MVARVMQEKAVPLEDQGLQHLMELLPDLPQEQLKLQVPTMEKCWASAANVLAPSEPLP